MALLTPIIQPCFTATPSTVRICPCASPSVPRPRIPLI
ncbi:unnamed protein product [Mesocestoides corti]|uniref:Uncharacterized protein n=1 Tax=Mesocestoides corti TaxID=53468 RepID=A0A0R3UIT9_MESCO|nr:unnamed protein product [Mesocestoides corti]